MITDIPSILSWIYGNPGTRTMAPEPKRVFGDAGSGATPPVRLQFAVWLYARDRPSGFALPSRSRGSRAEREIFRRHCGNVIANDQR